MSEHGFDSKKLTSNMDKLLGGWVEDKALPCVQAMIMRRDELAYDNVFGWADMEKQLPLKPDSIFRIYSMTKVFTSVSMLMLLEEGRYKMHDTLSKFFPEFKDTMVAEYDEANRLSFVKPHREIIIRDLFTMASGIPYAADATTAERAMMEAMNRAQVDRDKGAPWDSRKMMREVAKCPLAFHPGEHWWYGYSIDVLGALVEYFTDKPLAEFMRERIFEPLGLEDTGFYVPEDKIDRLVTMYDVSEAGVFTPTVPDYVGEWLIPPVRASAGGGLLSTAKDVLRFAQMLLHEGELDGVRLISRKSVELMRTNHLSSQQLVDYNWDTQRGYGYGLAVRVMMHPEVAGFGSVGEFAWDGYAGTWFSVDPSEQMVSVFLVQTAPGRHYQFVPNFAQVMYGAIAD